MIPDKIHNSYLFFTINLEGEIQEIISGRFLIEHFSQGNSIYQSCPFLQNTLDGLVDEISQELSGMLIFIDNQEFNVNLSVTKKGNIIEILFQDQTKIYKYITELNQHRNEFYLLKSELSKKNKELDQQKIIAEKANQEKSRFLAVMSHEIRNPIHSILSYAAIIADETKNIGVKTYAKTLQVSSENLLVIINDILDLSRIEAGKLELIEEIFSLKEILTICVEDFKIR